MFPYAIGSQLNNLWTSSAFECVFFFFFFLDSGGGAGQPLKYSENLNAVKFVVPLVCTNMCLRE